MQKCIYDAKKAQGRGSVEHRRGTQDRGLRPDAFSVRRLRRESKGRQRGCLLGPGAGVRGRDGEGLAGRANGLADAPPRPGAIEPVQPHMHASWVTPVLTVPTCQAQLFLHLRRVDSFQCPHPEHRGCCQARRRVQRPHVPGDELHDHGCARGRCSHGLHGQPSASGWRASQGRGGRSYRGRPEDKPRNDVIATTLRRGISWSQVQAATGCSRATVAKVAGRVREAKMAE